jgi:hypothetical protein
VFDAKPEAPNVIDAPQCGHDIVDGCAGSAVGS